MPLILQILFTPIIVGATAIIQVIVAWGLAQLSISDKVWVILSTLAGILIVLPLGAIMLVGVWS